MGNVIVKLAVQYLETHPDQMVALLKELVTACIKALEAKNAAAAPV